MAAGDYNDPYDVLGSSAGDAWGGAGGSYTSGGGGAQGIYDSYASPQRAQTFAQRTQQASAPSWTGSQTWYQAPPVQPPASEPAAPRSPLSGGGQPAWNAPSFGGAVQTPEPPAPTIDTSAWDTDGFAAPAQLLGGYGNVMAGWDAGKWADPNRQTPKYVAGRILSKYTPSIENAARAAQEIALAYPGTRFNGKDKILIPGVGEIDVLANSGSGRNMAWWWGAEPTGRQAAQAPSQGAQGPGGVDPFLALLASLQQPQYAPQPAPVAQPQAPAVDPGFASMMTQLQTLLAELQSAQRAQAPSAPRFTYY